MTGPGSFPAHERETTFEAFYAGSARRLLTQLYLVTGDVEEARDCLQEAFARAWTRWDAGRGRATGPAGPDGSAARDGSGDRSGEGGDEDGDREDGGIGGRAGHEDPFAWVYTVGYRIAVSRFRRRLAFSRALRRTPDPAPVPGPGPDVTAVRDALATLPHGQRAALVLHYYQGLSVDEIAPVLGVTPSAVKSRLARGRAALAPLLADELPDGEEVHRD